MPVVVGQVRMDERGHDDQEALDPHADEDAARREENQRNRAQLLDRQNRERDDEVAGHHQPEHRRVGPGDFRPEHRHLGGLVAVPRHQVFGEREIKPEQAHREEHLAEVVEVNRQHVVLEVKIFPDQHHRNQQRGDARENRAHHEIGPEDRAVPHRHDRHREVERHDGVHRDGDRNDHERHDADGLFEPHPFALGAPPPQCERTVELLAPAPCLVARDGHVGNHRQVEIRDAADQVRVDGHEIPHQRRLEVRPQVAAVRIRNHPVEQPGAAQMDDGEERSCAEREGGDGFRAAGDRPAPFRLHHAENRRDERAGVADADPEHERGDVEAPERRPVLAHHADAHAELQTPGGEHRQRDHNQDRDHEVVHTARFEDGTEQVFVDLLFGKFGH